MEPTDQEIEKLNVYVNTDKNFQYTSNGKFDFGVHEDVLDLKTELSKDQTKVSCITVSNTHGAQNSAKPEIMFPKSWGSSDETPRKETGTGLTPKSAYGTKTEMKVMSQYDDLSQQLKILDDYFGIPSEISTKLFHEACNTVLDESQDDYSTEMRQHFKLQSKPDSRAFENEPKKSAFEKLREMTLSSKDIDILNDISLRNTRTFGSHIVVNGASHKYGKMKFNFKGMQFPIGRNCLSLFVKLKKAGFDMKHWTNDLRAGIRCGNKQCCNPKHLALTTIECCNLWNNRVRALNLSSGKSLNHLKNDKCPIKYEHFCMLDAEMD